MSHCDRVWVGSRWVSLLLAGPRCHLISLLTGFSKEKQYSEISGRAPRKMPVVEYLSSKSVKNPVVWDPEHQVLTTTAARGLPVFCVLFE